MKALMLAAVGLALVMGIIVGGIVGDLFGASAQPTSAAAATGGACYTNWNSADCAAGYTAVETGVWTGVGWGYGPNPGHELVCATKRTPEHDLDWSFNADTDGADSASTTSGSVVSDWPCAICCATGPSVVGGIAEPPAAASVPGAGTSGIGSGTYAVLAGAAAGVLSFLVLTTLYARRRWLR